MRTAVDDTSNLLNTFIKSDGANLPLPGAGSTWKRFATLADWASLDLSLGRLCEGHADALAILAEAGRPVVEGASYGVWASRSSTATTFAERAQGGWVLSGAKEFCSGCGTIDRALVTAVTGEGNLLFDISVSEQVVSLDENSWPAVGMAHSDSRTVHFGGPVIADDAVVGEADFYLKRPGFWFGAVGVAACWYGGAVGLVNGLTDWINPEADDLKLANLGALFGELESMRYMLKSVARAIDDDPTDLSRQSQARTLVARHVVHEGASRVLQGIASVGGARPLCHDAQQSRRAADLFVYLSQHHGDADTREIGRIFTQSFPWS
ncbi:MAG: acyl-CoA dehydrogenase [Acidobacteria bacterium]|nr:acyl-CoA dehydrogenase [Acidobacteriota bacterium]